MKSYRGLAIRCASRGRFLDQFGTQENHFIIGDIQEGANIGYVRLILDHHTELLRQQMMNVTKGVNRIQKAGKIRYRSLFKHGHQFLLPHHHILTRNFCSGSTDKSVVTKLIQECLTRIVRGSYDVYHVIVEVRSNRTDDVWNESVKKGFWGISQSEFAY